MSRAIRIPLLVLAPLSILLFLMPPARAQSPGDAQGDDKALEQLRDDLQATETQVIARTVSLTTEEATKFWPLFERFQTEQKGVIDAQAKAIREFTQQFEQLTDEQAMAYAQSLLDRDQKIHDLRVKYLAEFARILPPAKAARTIQVSRRLGVLYQARLASSLPLVH